MVMVMLQVVFTEFSVQGLDVLDTLPPVSINTITSRRGSSREASKPRPKQ